eukprot:TRINITY_DN4556_c0_g1_i3.p1 TRINITY_DN4556_c0_g1~~TRINITY_DN4556_c0_g1_i3.p1  ORF type:complete len:186 (+),score=38.96 TRINITY_DN4556_c0_g1_i3:224-781(+)
MGSAAVCAGAAAAVGSPSAAFQHASAAVAAAGPACCRDEAAAAAGAASPFRERGQPRGRGGALSPRAPATPPPSPRPRFYYATRGGAKSPPQPQQGDRLAVQALCTFHLEGHCEWGKKCRDKHVAPALLERLATPSAAAAAAAQPGAAAPPLDMQRVRSTTAELLNRDAHPERGYAASAARFFKD